MRAITCMLLVAAVIFGGCGTDKDLKSAGDLVEAGEIDKAIELYTSIIGSQKGTETADAARLALGKLHCGQKNYEGAIKNLEEISEKRRGADDVRTVLEQCKKDRLLLEAIKSAAVEFRQAYVKEKEVKHQEIDYTVSIFTGTADGLIGKTEVKKPADAALDKYKVDLSLTDDPLEPTRIRIEFPDGFKKEIMLNY